MSINFNADVGEGFDNEHLLMPYLHSCNIACGGHAGDVEEMERVVKLAVQHGVGIGAHPAFEDRENFGRLPLPVSPIEIFESVSKQIMLLRTIVSDYGTVLSHVKPHGALYHQVCSDEKTAAAIIDAVKATSPESSIVGLPNSILEKMANKLACKFIKEGFADRRYHANGSLVNRIESKALITNKEEVLVQVQNMTEGKIDAIEATRISVQIDTICFHSDTQGAADLLKHCYERTI